MDATPPRCSPSVGSTVVSKPNTTHSPQPTVNRGSPSPHPAPTYCIATSSATSHATPGTEWDPLVLVEDDDRRNALKNGLRWHLTTPEGRSLGPHNPKVVGSNPTPATIESAGQRPSHREGLFRLATFRTGLLAELLTRSRNRVATPLPQNPTVVVGVRWPRHRRRRRAHRMRRRRPLACRGSRGRRPA